MTTETNNLLRGWKPLLLETPVRPAAQPAPAATARQRIVRPTAVLIDKSKPQLIALGRRVVELLSPLCQEPFFVYAFDTMAYKILRNAADAGRWERPLARILPGGNTAGGAPVECMRIRQEYVQQFVLVTDEEENASPTFHDAYQTYAECMRVRPEVFIVRGMGASSLLEQRCRQRNIPVEVFAHNGCLQLLPALVPLMTRAFMLPE